MPTRTRAALLAVALLALPRLAQAAQPFDAQAFRDAQAAGRTILVDVSATWCPTCKAQRPIVQEIERANPQLVTFDVDFDTAKDVLKQFRVSYQGTLIVFKGKKEVARSTGDSNPDNLRNLVTKGF